MRIAAYIVTGFWLLFIVFLCFTYRTISGEVARYILEMATISVIGTAILEAVRKR